MDTESRFKLIKEVGEEILTEQELKELLETKKNPIAYDISSRGINVPSALNITAEEIDYICNEIKKILDN